VNRTLDAGPLPSPNEQGPFQLFFGLNNYKAISRFDRLSLSEMAMVQQLPGAECAWARHSMYYNVRHGAPALACCARQEAENAGLIWTVEALVDHMGT
jgi:hypothetical protein